MAKEPKDVPAQDPIGLLEDGSISIGTPDEMRAKWDKAKAEEYAEEHGLYADALLGELNDEDNGDDSDLDEEDPLKDLDLGD